MLTIINIIAAIMIIAVKSIISRMTIPTGSSINNRISETEDMSDNSLMRCLLIQSR